MGDILVVDDDPTVREVVVSYLRANGHRAREAAEGETALTMLRQEPADLGARRHAPRDRRLRGVPASADT
ncbi:response regulator [Janibacter sp. GS2]|uniref:response regulator n=1 Tax=Janibacter sp. GS2 TaxID=3442646 RepID=UPI003EB6D709